MTRLPERALLLLLASVMFTHIMDFMVLMPLGPQLMRSLGINAEQFSWIVSAYTLSAGTVGLLAAPFVDRFDRRFLLLIAYAGFAAGSLACALAHSHIALLIARIICGAFGGISGTLVMAIVSDVVPAERRAAGMGVIMGAFSFAAALGVPFGLWLAHRYVWEAPFILLAALSGIMWLLIAIWLPPIRGHLTSGRQHGAASFIELLRDPTAGRALLFMAVMVFGHFAIIPFLSPFLVSNVGIAAENVWLVFMVGGVCSVLTTARVGRLADRHGRHRIFYVLVAVAVVVTLTLTQLGQAPLWQVLSLAGMFFVFASGRFIPAQAIMSLAVPPSRRGAFMSLNSCARDLAAGCSAAVGGKVISESATGQLVHYTWMGWIAVAAAVISVWLASRVRTHEQETSALAQAA